MSDVKILVVDDEERIRKLVRTYLERRGYLVKTAQNGLEALQLVGDDTPDLIIADVNMPFVNGLELVQRLRASRRTARIPVIMLSALKEMDDVLAGYAQGADEYVPKPVEMVLLAAKIETLLRRAHVTEEREPHVSNGRVVMFAHAKGGVGATTLAVNTAVSLASTAGYRVALLDLNAQFGNAALMLDLQPGCSIAQLADMGQGLDEELLRQLITRHASGVEVVAAANVPEQAELLTVAAVQQAIEQFRERVDYVILDTPAWLSEINLAAMDLSHVICLVTAPRLASLRATADYLNVLARVEPAPGQHTMLALNHIAPGGLDTSQVASFLGRDIDFLVPHGAFFDDAADHGKPVVTARPELPEAVEIRGLAKRLAAAAPVLV